MAEEHRPVMVDQVLSALALPADGVAVDCTFGRGGHAAAILASLGPRGRVLAMDRDPQARPAATDLMRRDHRLSFEATAFDRLGPVVSAHDLAGRVNGVLFDLGVSSPQLDQAARGFSFRADGPLDMRMDPDSGPSAAQWLASADVDEIAAVLRRLGDERHARRIARRIVARRDFEPVDTTARLADLVASCLPPRRADAPRRHPATRTFQAIRMHVNHEVEQLERALPQAVDALAPGGRLAVVSFHSIEDRMVKRFIRDESTAPGAPRKMPVVPDAPPPRLRRIGGALRPCEHEVETNPRARSAVLRVAERVH